MMYNYGMKKPRDFIYCQGLPDNPYGTTTVIRAKSSLEAGAIAIEQGIVESGYIPHSLIDPADAP